MIISKDWKIESDDLNVTIFERRYVTAEKSKDGVAHDNWSAKGFFSTPKNALNWLVNHKVMSTGMGDLKTVVDSIDEIRSMIKGLKC